MNSTALIKSRVVVIGDSSVGKTSILNKLAYNNFNQNELATIGSNYQMYIQQIQDVKIELQIWDTAGQERFRSLSSIYFRNADVAIVVYDHTCFKSFRSLEMWIKEFIDVAGPDKIIIIIANKHDLDDSQVPFQEAEAWADSKNYTIYQVSAKTGEGIKELFSDLARTILEKQMSSASSINTKPKQIEESDHQHDDCC